ncbi:hypothetical protein Tsubulata_017378 [Turnera subulata]|uniref:DUF4283 domain-containing protein n=1 Tax=Turnera subulata TaxID=218843 RepID=A0A9Q0FYC0_9ROSI|nr:hypothetical protein Tsubulata_017378 [Turnera subulata]
MASCATLPSPLLVDSSREPRERTATVLDLDRLTLLLKASSHVQQKLKGKEISDFVLVPISTSEHASLPLDSSIAGEPRVPLDKPTDLGLFTTAAGSSLSRPEAATHSWASITSGSAHPLKFVPPIFAADSKIMQIPFELLDIGRKKFSLCLVGQFMGKSPKLGLVTAMAERLWGRDGVVSIAPYKENLYLFQFPTESSLSRALYGGPWHIGGIPLLLRKWDANIEPVDFSTSLIPVWVQLKRVPPELLTKEGLSYIASAIGTPLHMNQDYSKLLFSDRVNIYVEVNFYNPLIDELAIEFDGCVRTIDISYSWKPQHCDLCNTWGHCALACPTKKSVPDTVHWVPKSTTVTANSSIAAGSPSVIKDSIPTIVHQEVNSVAVSQPIVVLIQLTSQCLKLVLLTLLVFLRLVLLLVL